MPTPGTVVDGAPLLLEPSPPRSEKPGGGASPEEDAAEEEGADEAVLAPGNTRLTTSGWMMASYRVLAPCSEGRRETHRPE